MEASGSAYFTFFWFLSVIVAAVVAHVVAKFIQKPLDSLSSNVSYSWKRKSEKRKEEFDKYVDSVYKSELKIIKLMLNQAIYLLLFSFSIVMFFLLHIFVYVSPYPGNNIVFELLLFITQALLVLLILFCFRQTWQIHCILCSCSAKKRRGVDADT